MSYNEDIRRKIGEIYDNPALSPEQKMRAIKNIVLSNGGEGKSASGTNGGGRDSIGGQTSATDSGDESGSDVENMSGSEAAEAAQQAADEAKAAAQQAKEKADKTGDPADRAAAEDAKNAADAAQKAADAAKSAAASGDEDAARDAAEAAQDAAAEANNAAGDNSSSNGNSRQNNQGKNSSSSKGEVPGEKGFPGSSGKGSSKGSQNDSDKGSDVSSMSGSEAAEAAQQAADEAKAAAQQAKEKADKTGDPADRAAAEDAKNAADAAQKAADAAKSAAASGDEDAARDAAEAAQDAAAEANNAAGNNQSGQGSQSQQNQQGGQQNSQNSQNQQNQQGKSGQQQGGGKSDKDAIEDMLKDLDLSKKMQSQGVKQSKGDDGGVSVEGLPNDDSSPQQPGGGGGEEFDPYLAGKYIGIAYAKEVYKNHGHTPTYGYKYELPVVPKMKLIESLSESLDDDIIKILGSGASREESINAIYDALFPEPEIPEQIIPLRNDGINKDDLMGRNSHITTKEKGEAMRKELENSKAKVQKNINPTTPGYGISDKPSDVLPRIGAAMDRAKRLCKGDPAKLEAIKKFEHKVGIRVKKNREGIIDWKTVLAQFITTSSRNTEKGPIRRNVYYKSGIGAKRTVYSEDSLNKIVIYVDTSGSVNNDETQLIPLMASEIVKIADDCEVNEFDLHLFTDKVYSENYGVTKDSILSDEFGLNDVQNGGTDLNKVYNHIFWNYIEDGELDPEVSCIVIITDLDLTATDMNSITDQFEVSALERLLFIIYDNYNRTYLSREEVEADIRPYIPKESVLMTINTKDFEKNFGKIEDMKESYNVMNEAIGKVSDMRARREAKQQPMSDERRDAVIKIARIQGARETGTLNEIYPEVYEIIKNNFRDWKDVKDYSSVEGTPNSFYIDDDGVMTIHSNFNKDNIEALFDICNTIDVKRIIGDIDLIRDRKTTGFPATFPKVLNGTLNIDGAYVLSDFTHLPVKVDIVKYDPKTKSAKLSAGFNDWVNRSQIGTLINSPVIRRPAFKNESVDDAHARFELGIKYLAEAKGVNYFGQFLKPAGLRTGAKLDADVFEPLNQIYKDNVEIFNEIVIPLLPVDWGKLPKSAIKVMKTRKEITDQLKGGIKSFYGMNIYTSEDDKISLIYAKPKRSENIKILGFRTPIDSEGNGGEFITDQKEIRDEFKRRDQVFRAYSKKMTELGFSSGQFPFVKGGSNKVLTVTDFLLDSLYFTLSKFSGVDMSSRKFVDSIVKRDGTINGTSVDGLGDTEVRDVILNGIFDGNVKQTYSGVRFTVSIDDGGKYERRQDIVLDGDGSRNKGIFIDLAKESIDYNDYNITDVFTSDFLMNVLVALSLRDNEADDTPVYGYDEVMKVYDEGNADELENMLKDCLEVNFYKTLYRMNDYKIGNDKSKSDSTPYDLIFLFPGLFERCISIEVDVEDSAIERLMKTVRRKLGRVGMRDDIITGYDTDPSTGERVPRKILGTDSLSKLGKAGEMDIIDELGRIATDSHEYVGIYPEILTALSSIMDTKKQKEVEESLKSISNNIGIAYTTVKDQQAELDEMANSSDPDIQKKYKEFVASIDGIIDLYYRFTGVVRDELYPLIDDATGNKKAIVDCVKEIKEISDNIGENFKKISNAGENAQREVNAIRKKGARNSTKRIPVPSEDDSIVDTINKLDRLYSWFYTALDAVFDADDFNAERARTKGEQYIKATTKMNIGGTKAEIVNGMADAVADAIEHAQEVMKSNVATSNDDGFKKLAAEVYDFVENQPERRGSTAAEIEAAVKKAVEIYDLATELSEAGAAGTGAGVELASKASSLFKGVIDAIKLIDFATADRRAVSTFGTKNGMLNKIKTELTSAIAYGNAEGSAKLGKAFEDMFADLVEEMETIVDYATSNTPNINRALSQAAKKIYEIAMDITTEAEDAGVSIAAGAGVATAN